MPHTINAYIVLDGRIDSSLIDAAIPSTGRVTLTGFAEGFDSGDEAVRDNSTDLLVVAFNGEPQDAIEFIRKAATARPERPVVALGENLPDYLVESALGAGADDIVKLPETPERVLFALEKAVARRRGGETAVVAGAAPMVCVLGPKGGTGKTVTATNFVVGLAEAGRRAVIVDLDLQFGDVGLALGVEPDRTIYDLATSGGALDAEKLDAYLATHSSGARALLAPVRPDQAGAISTELLREVYSLLRISYEMVVVDTPPDFTPEVIAAIDASSHVCMVGNMDALSLKNTKLGLETLELMGYDSDAVTLLLNRADTDVGLTSGDVEEIAGREPDLLVPSDRNVPRSLNEGTPIIAGRPQSRVADAFRRLTEIYAPVPAQANGHRRRLLGMRRAAR